MAISSLIPIPVHISAQDSKRTPTPTPKRIIDRIKEVKTSKETDGAKEDSKKKDLFRSIDVEV